MSYWLNIAKNQCAVIQQKIEEMKEWSRGGQFIQVYEALDDVASCASSCSFRIDEQVRVYDEKRGERNIETGTPDALEVFAHGCTIKEMAEGIGRLALKEARIDIDNPNKAVSELSDLALLYRIHLLHNLGDATYAVREREGEGWEGPEVVAYGQLVDEMNKRLRESGIVKVSDTF